MPRLAREEGVDLKLKVGQKLLTILGTTQALRLKKCLPTKDLQKFQSHLDIDID